MKRIMFVVLIALVTVTINLQITYAFTHSEDNFSIISTEVTDFSITEEQSFLVFSGEIGNSYFSINASAYKVFDALFNNKVHIIENERNFDSDIIVLNLEFEKNAKKENLNAENFHLEGKDVLRLAVYMNENFYYVEQEHSIDSLLTENINYISLYDQENEILEKIQGNSNWYKHINEPDIVNETDMIQNSFFEYSILSTPGYGSSLDNTDIDVLSMIGISKFNKVQFVYGWTYLGSTIVGGYLIRSNEWPVGTGSILTEVLYYEIVTNTPTTSSANAELQFQLIADREYRWMPDTNTVEAWFRGTAFRIYDVKLAMETAQVTSGQGYDYISSRTLYLNSTQSNNGDIALSIAKQFDKYNIITWTQLIFDAFSSSDKDSSSGISHAVWPQAYDAHYNSISNQKRRYTMVRGVRVDSKGHKLIQEGNHYFLSARIEDRDYENSSTNVQMTKAIKYAFSYNLRSKDPFWIWLFNGQDRGNITGETRRSYTR